MKISTCVFSITIHSCDTRSRRSLPRLAFRNFLTLYRDLFPAGLLNETLRTLDLLFPPRRTENDKSIKWLENEILEHKLDPGLRKHRDCIITEDRRADKYKFWGERLSILHEEFKDPHVSSIRQFWHDTRNKPQWYTFWVAMLILLLTLFFGFIQSIEGALQVYKAYHPS